MKIAIFSDCYLDLSGGIVTVINAEKAELERRGHTVYVFSSAYPRSKEQKTKLSREHIYPVPTCRIFGRGATPIARRPAKVEKWLMKNHPELADFDIIYVHYEAGCSIAGLRLGRRLNIPTVQVMHGREDMGEALIIPLGFRTIVATALNLFHSWYLPHDIKVVRDNYLATTIAKAKMWSIMVNHAEYADVVITPSDYFRKMLIYYGVTKPIHALHHGIADQYVDMGVSVKTLAPGEPIRIIWHSRLSPEKRIMPFLEALNILQNSAYHLDVFGDGPEIVAARAYVKLHRLNVSFHGKAKFDKIWEQLQHSHLDTLVSYNYDTFGMSLIEAESAGVPTLIVDPDLEEIVPRGGYLLAKSASPTSIAESISDLLSHPERVAKMSEIMISHRDANKISLKVDKLEVLFNDIIKS
ncbi:glycosyltransferase [Candidatus Saccharibacteria bacterium]|nr:glycosyltransferase [Candidatus Saccharibacteria bacterium]